MTRVQEILQTTETLTEEERKALISGLLEQQLSFRADDLAVGQWGLAALTESTRNEDWSDDYPEEFRELARTPR